MVNQLNEICKMSKHCKSKQIHENQLEVQQDKEIIPWKVHTNNFLFMSCNALKKEQVSLANE